MTVLVALAIAAALGGAVAWARRRRRQRRRFLSIALFLAAPRALDEVALRRAVDAAWGVRCGAGDDATEFAVGSPPVLMASARGCLFLVNVLDRNYFGRGPRPDPGAPRGAPAHAAFLSVDFLRSERPGSDAELYRMIGSLVERLLAPDCVALFLPPSSRVFTLDTPGHVAAIRDALRSEDVLAALERLMAAPDGPAADPARGAG